MVKQKSLKGAKDQPDDPVYKMDKFFGEGVMFKCKIFGYQKVAGPRGDEMCAEAIGQLKQHARQLNKEQKIHKQRIFLNISLKGIRIIDQQSRKLEHAHVVHKISYISHDKDDRRTFGYIVSLPDGYHLFAFKAEKNAGIITSNLKELFHVVYLKHKHDREKQGNPAEAEKDYENNRNKVDEGEEAKEEIDENPYAVPVKFQLFEDRRPEDGNSYAVPSGQPAFDTDDVLPEDQEATENNAGNLLDWTDVNEELEIMQKDLKRSDTKQLLAELGDFDLDSNPPHQPNGQNVFSDDPFFGQSSSASDFPNGRAAAFSSGSEQEKPDPFFSTADDFSPPPSITSSAENTSNNFGVFDNNDAFAPAVPETKQSNSQPFSSEVGDLFNTTPTQSQASMPFNNDWSASFANTGNAPFANTGSALFANTGSVQQFSALQPTSNENSLFSAIEQPPSVDLQPEKLGEPKKGNEDPFAALSGGISDIRGTLPAASGGNVPQFPKKTKPVPTSESTRVISPGPPFQPTPSGQPGQFAGSGFGQQQPFQPTSSVGFSQSNPFNQPNMQYNTGGYSPRMNVPPIPSRSDMPPIPARQDLMSGSGFQSMQPVQQQPMQQQQFPPPIPKPYSQSHQAQGSIMRGNPTSPTPPQPTVDPFAGLGGAFSMSQTTATQEPLYAVVDKSQKTNQTADQVSADMFGIFDNSKSVNGTHVSGASTGNSDQDPFGFGF